MSAAHIPVYHARTKALVGTFDPTQLPRISVGDEFVVLGGARDVVITHERDQHGAIVKLFVKRASDLYKVPGFALD